VTAISTPSAPGRAERLPTHTVIAYSLLAMPYAGLLLSIGLLMPRFYAGQMGVTLGAVGGAFLIIRLLDICLDPVVGLLMDRTRTPIGRYRPWVIAGAIVLMFSIYKAFNPPAGVGLGYMILWLFIVYAGYSMYVLGQAAWGASISVSYNDRARTYGWMQAIGVIASITLLMLAQITGHRIQFGANASMGAIGWILIAMVPVCTIITLMFTPERPDGKVARPKFTLNDYLTAISRPDMRRIIGTDLALTLGVGITAPIYIFFFHDAKGFSIANTSSLLVFYTGAGLLGSPAWARIARMIGKHRAVQAACVTYALAQTALMMLPKAQYLPTALFMFIVGGCASAFVPLIRAMVADMSDEIRLATQRDLTSCLYAMVTTTQKIGLAVSIAVIYPILGLIGYKAAETAHNTPGAVFGLEMCYLFAPIIFVAFGMVTLIGYKLDAKKHAGIRAALEARDGLLDEAASLETLTGVSPAAEALSRRGGGAPEAAE
jgi:glycoside/pentoside/hexuronide:cation symporter, GPH family